MAKGSISNQQKKEFAKTLYFANKELSQKELAQRVEVTEKTIAKWIAEGEWTVLRQSLIVSKKDQIARLYAITEAVTNKIDDSEGGIGDTKLADMMIKYTAAINNLETDTNIAETVDVMMSFGSFVHRHYPENFKLITEMSDAFVQEKLK
jgi:DNA-binding XRE family transcriptional regulator